jgi:glycosyltransferase involved in cell wall biosynthesis
MRCSQNRLPTIAIVTPSYNQARYLEQTIRSVLDNGYPLLKYAVVDGGSHDETRMILNRCGHRLTYWVSEPDRGQSHAIQKGFEQVNGEIMGYLNSDDILLPGALGLVAAYFATHPGVDVVYGHRILINESGLEVGRWILPPHSNEATKRADYIPQETLFWRSEVYRQVGGIDTSFRFAMDWDLILRFQAAGVVFRRLPYFLACFRIHEAQKTSAIKESVGDVEVDLLRARELGDNRSSWNVRKYDQAIKRKAFITELGERCGLRSTRF